MSIKQEFMDMDPDEYEDTVRAFASINKKSSDMIGVAIPASVQEILDAPLGTLAQKKREADEWRKKMPLKVEYAIGPKREITLEEVRELVETTKDWDGNTRVNIKIFEGDQRDPTTSSITVRKP